MSGTEELALPGTPGPALRALWESLDPETKAIARDHLLGGTSAEWLSLCFTEHGHRIGATTIKTYRRSLRGPE